MDSYPKSLDLALQDIAKEKGYDNARLKVTPVNTAGAGYTSHLYRGKISAPNKEDLKFFAKLAALNAEARSKLPLPLFFTEQYTYTRLTDIFRKIEDKHNVTQQHRFVFPIMYGHRDTDLEEVIVMQDLSAEGFMLQDRFTSFNWQYASAAVQQIARFHALSIAMQHDFQDDFKEVKETYKLKSTDAYSLQEIVLDTALKSIELIKEEHRDRLRIYLNDYLPKAIATYYDIPPRPVINHGDFRMSNIMHKEREDGSVEAILIDFQILHVASPVKDLMFFIFTGSDAAFRARHYNQLLDHYYQQLCLALMRLHLNPEEVFTREDFDKDLKENSLLGLLFALHTLPVVTVSEEQAPPPSGELSLDTFKRLDASQLCRDRLDEVVEDYLRWGLI